ncbi:hypothetical protein R3P38DRAFT_2780718 [Favolaschia claudopus]|uniref:Uncharacterized protein n=1 Tax=Favolaschia claudopus TaxID=2862362 RepID=A0AAW0B5S0_9AGAR
MSVEGYVRKRHTPVIRPVPGHMNDGVNQIPVSYRVASSRRALRPSSLASMNGGARRRRPPRNPAHFQLIPFPQPAIRPTPTAYFRPYTNAPASLCAWDGPTIVLNSGANKTANSSAISRKSHLIRRWYTLNSVENCLNFVCGMQLSAQITQYK